LPLVLLGIPTAIKEVPNATAVEMTYGAGIRLPVEFFVATVRQATSEYANRLKERIEETKLQPINRHGTKNVFIFRELVTSPYVFLRTDAVRSPLQPPYDLPYKVVQRGEENFTIKINNRNVMVSVDRVRPAFLINNI
jgi:hypothetical protein